MLGIKRNSSANSSGTGQHSNSDARSPTASMQQGRRLRRQGGQRAHLVGAAAAAAAAELQGPWARVRGRWSSSTCVQAAARAVLAAAAAGTPCWCRNEQGEKGGGAGLLRSTAAAAPASAGAACEKLR